MRKISCPIIQDLLPLYIDEVVSDETREMVEEHVKHCDLCNKEMKMMKQELVLPIEKKAPMLQNFKKKLRNKKMIVSGISVLLTALILFGGHYLLFHHDTFIPYSDSLVQIEIQDNGNLAAHYYGESLYSTNITAPMNVTIDGKEKRAIFLYYTKTFSDNPTRNLFSGNKPRQEHDFLFPLDPIDDVDVVYYAEFDAMKVFDNGGNWEDVVDRAELMWEK